MTFYFNPDLILSPVQFLTINHIYSNWDQMEVKSDFLNPITRLGTWQAASIRRALKALMGKTSGPREVSKED